MYYLENIYRLINKYNQKSRKARTYGTEDLLYPAEVHLMEIIGAYREITTTKLAEVLGITKGAVSQTTTKLLSKELITKSASKERTNEVQISLSEKGQVVFQHHRKLHENMINRVDCLVQGLPHESKEVIQNMFQIIEESLDEV